MNVEQTAKLAKLAFTQLSTLTSKQKNDFLISLSKELNSQKNVIFQANKLDLKEEKNEQLKKRLVLDEEKLKVLTQGLLSLSKIKDPVGNTTLKKELDKGLILEKITCPIGSIGVIFEARPDAFVQIASLCFKSGNCVLLKGGKEAINTNKALFDIFIKVSKQHNINPNWIALLINREDVEEMLKLNEYIDLIVPRGSNKLVQYILDNTKIPILGHADGVCHIYVDEKADLDQAINICIDAKCNYPAACNAVETIIVNEKVAKQFLPKLKEKMPQVKFFGCNSAKKIIDLELTNKWHQEYGDLKVSVKIVSSLDEAISHINQFGSKHTDAIITKNKTNADKFASSVDSANVYWNCSTRFSDGFRYGFGAEVGIATSKIHARGPVGIDGLLTYKWKLKGVGNIVSDYISNKKKFTHKDLK